jgi:hypothetical protein
MRSSITAYFLLSPLLAGITDSVTKVTLSNLAQPSSGQALVGSVSVTGEGFPSGTIPAANVTVTLAPSTAGGGPTGTTQARSVTAAPGGNKRVAFQIPGSIAVSVPTAYKVTIAGSTSTGAKFSSRNSSALTVIPPSQITLLSPGSGNAALSLSVAITGQYTNFVQGTTLASFGPSISVGGAAEGQAGPVTVTSATNATAQITIDPAAATGPVTVTVTTGSQQASLADGFKINPAVAVVNIETAATTPLPPGFSGFSDPYLFTGVEYTDPKYIAMIQPLKPGFIRFPGGLQSMAFDWQAGHTNSTWLRELAPNIPSLTLQGLELAQKMTQAKGGACFTSTTGGTCYSNYADLVHTLGVATLVDFNGWTDTNPGSAANMVAAAQAAGLNVIDWELTNEPYAYPLIFPTAASYAASQNSYAGDIFSANPSASLGVFYQGQFSGVGGNYQAWDSGMAGYTPHYWNSVSMHMYPAPGNLTTPQEEQMLNGILAHGTNEYISSYVAPLIGADTPLFITEFSSDNSGAQTFESYIYNGIFLAEFVARMSTATNVKAIAVQPLFIGNNFNQGIIRAVNDFQNYLLAQLANNPSYSTNTAVDPNTQFEFYPSANALAMQVLNQAVNSSTFTWATTVSGGPSVSITGYDGNPIPALFAQGYQGSDGTHYLVITNKSGASVPVGVEVNGTLGPRSVTVSYISNPSDTAENTATAQTTVQVVNTTWANPMTIGPYSVTRLQW